MKITSHAALIFFLISKATAGLISRNLSQCENFYYQAKVHGKTFRNVLIKRGDYIIQGIVPLSSTSTNCTLIKQNGLVSMMSLQFAIERLHATSDFFNASSFGYQIDDSCNSVPTVMSSAIEIVSQFRNESVCKSRTCSDESADVKAVTAVVGPYQSFTSIPFSSLLGLFKVPIVSPSASSRLLSKKDLYKSFFRIIPSDVVQAKVIAELLKRFGWNYIYAIGSDDNYGKLGISILKGYREEFDFCIVADEYIPFMTGNMEAKAVEIVQEIAKHDNAKVVVFFGYNAQIELILSKAVKNNVERIWMMSDAFQMIGNGPMNVTEKSLIGILKVAPKSIQVEGLRGFIAKEIENNSHCNIFLKMFMQQRFGCKFEKSSVYCPNETSQSMADKMTQLETSLFGNTIDAFKSITTALKLLLTDKCSDKRGRVKCPADWSLDPRWLTEYLFKVNFTNINGDTFNFDASGDPKSPYYDISNIQKVGNELRMVKVGQWDPLKKLNLDLGRIVWPLWAGNATPLSTCSKDCPEGYFISARTECCWSCEFCFKNSISTEKNAENCTRCPEDYVSNAARTECVKYIFTYLKLTDVAGISITVVNIIGMLLCLLVIAGYRILKNTNFLKRGPRMAHVEFFSMLQLLFSFTYGILLLLKRSTNYCNIAVGGMYLLKAGFAILILARTQLFVTLIQRHIVLTVGISLQRAHLVSMMALALIQLALTIVCCVIDPVEMVENKHKSEHIVSIDCTFDYTTMQAITLLVYPHVLLLAATIIAVRERGKKHAYSQAKFLNFVAIAHCIVSVAFFPTYKYVIGIYRTIVMAFKIDVCAFTYMSCLLLPQLYIAFTEKNKISSPKEDATATDISMGDINKERLQVSKMES